MGQYTFRKEPRYRKRIISHKEYRAAYKKVMANVEASGSGWGFSAAVKVHFDKVNSDINQVEGPEHTEEKDELHFSLGTLQVFRRCTTIISIDGHASLLETTEWVTSVEEFATKSPEQLQNMS